MRQRQRRRQIHEWSAWQEWRLFRAYRLALTYEGIANRIGFADRDAVVGKIRRMRARDPVRWAARACDGRWREKRKGLLTAAIGSGRRRVPSSPRIAHVVARSDDAGVGDGCEWQREVDKMIGWKVNIPDHPLLSLRRDQCRWPIGEVGEAGFRYCCARKPDSDSVPYCTVHARLAAPGMRVGVDRARAGAAP